MLSNKKSILNLVFAGLFLFSFTSVFADDHNHSEDTDTHAVDNHDHEDLGHEAAADFGHEPDTGAFDAVGMIMAHIQDANEWHIATIGDAHTGTHISIPLPVIIYDGSLKVFLSNKVAHGHEHEGYAMDHHGQVYSATGL